MFARTPAFKSETSLYPTQGSSRCVYRTRQKAILLRPSGAEYIAQKADRWSVNPAPQGRREAISLCPASVRKCGGHAVPQRDPSSSSVFYLKTNARGKRPTAPVIKSRCRALWIHWKADKKKVTGKRESRNVLRQTRQ